MGPYTGKGVNAQRRALDRSGFGEEIHDARTTAPKPFLERAVIIDVLPEGFQALPDDKKNRYEAEVENASLLKSAPNGSAIGLIVGNRANFRGTKPAVFYPFFSHARFPIKPGEHVWVVFDDPVRAQTLGYWISRIVERVEVDDPNFTHADRRFHIPTGARSRSESELPGFPNGDETKDGRTLVASDGYEKIFNEAVADVDYEAVPRLIGKPGDATLEGSNNAGILISRHGGARSGFIDLAAGRPIPETVVNQRGYEEAVKGRRDSVGLPIDTAARVLISQRFDGDGQFELSGLPGTENGSVENVDDSSYVICVGNELRFVARGQVRIIRGGDGVQSSIFMDGDTVMINAPKIILGEGGNDQVHIGRGANEQVVLGNTLVSLIEQFCATLQTAVGNNGAPLPQVVQAAAELRAQVRTILSQNTKTK